MIQQGDAAPLPTVVEDASILDETPEPSGLEDRSMQSKDPRPTAHRKRGRPRRQIQAIETDHLENEPKRRLRSRIPAGAAADDPWVMLSKAPSRTPLSPNKPQKAASMQKQVNDPLFCPRNRIF
jgi:hypothetical protein